MTFFNREISKLVSADDIIEDCIMALTCPYSRFYPNKDFGNRIKSSNDYKQLLASSRQAVSNIDGVFVKSLSVNDGLAEFTIMVNDEARRVSIDIE